MKKYRVVVTANAKADFVYYRDYLIYEKKSRQAAKSLLEDYKDTRKKLEVIADSIKEPESTALKKRKLKRINFMRHNYFLLYSVKGNTVYVTNMFHGLEDYESKIR